jgi:short-subunit dehydrogenase involved in D-alanine esterification of teichoic acids
MFYYIEKTGGIIEMIESKNRVVLITGGSSGIGYEMAKLMLEGGSDVIICGRSQEKLDETKRKLPKVTTIRCDITSAAERKALVEKMEKDVPNLNMLMNNAGIVHRYLLATTGDLTSRITEELETNYLAPVILIQLILPILIKNKGTVVNVSSGLAHLPLSIEPNYCATKAAMHSMTQSMRIQYAKVHVKVIEILYPEVNTPFQEGHATERAISPKLAAEEALRQLNRGKDEIYVKMSKMLYWISRLAPKRGITIVNRFIPDKVEEMLRKR